MKPFIFIEGWSVFSKNNRNVKYSIGAIFFPWEDVGDGKRALNITVCLVIIAFSIGIGVKKT